MTVSKKQLEANKKNAQKGGVKTPEGKAIVKYNALKHGLLAKETVITVGEGAESPEEFNAFLEDLKTQLAPAGTLARVSYLHAPDFRKCLHVNWLCTCNPMP